MLFQRKYFVLVGFTLLLTVLFLSPSAFVPTNSLENTINSTLASGDPKTYLPTIMNGNASPRPYMEYVIYNEAIILDPDPLPVLPNGMGDYHALFARYNLCNLISNGGVDEVWIWAGNGDGVALGHLLEWTTSGPGWSGLTPNCGKVATTMTFNFTRETAAATHSYGHRMEGLMRHHQPCDFSTATWPWDAKSDNSGDFDDCDNLLSNTYGYVARPFDGNNHVGGCGDVHYPPNMTQADNREYIYHETRTAQSICPNWNMDGSAEATNVNCQMWGCSEYGYQIWWMQNFPGLDNNNRDRNGDPMPNWWQYLFGGIAPNSAQTNAYSKINTSNSDYFATSSHQASAIQHDSQRTLQIGENINSKTVTGLDPVVKPVAFVIVLTAYTSNGQPRDSYETQTSELIIALREATIYHGYENTSYLQATFLGQDGASYAGMGCTVGTVPDNIHIQVSGMKTDSQPISYLVEEPAGGGVWATPCNPVSNWFLHIESSTVGEADLYFKPFRAAPDGTIYNVVIDYEDGSRQSVSIVGSHVSP